MPIDILAGSSELREQIEAGRRRSTTIVGQLGARRPRRSSGCGESFLLY